MIILFFYEKNEVQVFETGNKETILLQWSLVSTIAN